MSVSGDRAFVTHHKHTGKHETLTMTIHTCFFDMGNVLVHFSHDRMCRNVADACRLSLDGVRNLLFTRQRQWQMERGEFTEEQLLEEIVAHGGRNCTLQDLRHALADIFWLNDSIVPVLEELRSAGRKLVLLSNTSETHLRFITERFRILQLMDDRVASFEVGAMKPDARIFEAALAKAGCDPKECFYTDDIPAYIETARSYGIQSFVYRDTQDLRQHLRATGAL